MGFRAFPDGEDGIIEVKLAGVAVQGSAATVVDTWTAPYKCRLVRCVTDCYKKGTTDVDDVRVEATGSLTLVEIGDMAGDENSTVETLAADALANDIDAGDVVTLYADTADGTEAALWLSVTLGFKPL